MQSARRPHLTIWIRRAAPPGGVFGLALALLLAACGLAGSDGAQPGAVLPLAPVERSPEAVVTDFLNAWKTRSYETMYALLSPQSQAFYTLPVFQAQYENAASTMNLTDLSFQVHRAQLQGMSAAVTYDVTLTSPVFGTIEDRGRTMRLVRTPGGWGIAWSSMDIFDALAAGARLEVRSRRPARANIYDRNGELLVEEGGAKISLYVAQQSMSNVDACLTLLASVLMRQRYELAALFANNLPETVFYVGEIDPEVDAARGAELDSTCAVRRLERQTRRYDGNGGAVHVIGYIGQIPADQLERWQSLGYSAGDLIGRAGIEAAYERELGGQPEQVLRIVTPSGLLLRELAGKSGTEPQSVTLTLDRRLQWATAQALADAYNYAEPNWAALGLSPGAGAVVLDVNTGAVLALASYPFFDPGVFNPDTPAPAGSVIAALTSDSRQPFKNRVTQEQYFPGSTFKIITTAAAANERLVTPTETFFCDLTWPNGPKYGDTLPVRSDWRKTDGLEPAGEVTMALALTASCNPFFYEMGARLYIERAPDRLVEYARRLGLGRKTGLDPILPEVTGSLPTPASVEQAINNAIGQGETQVTIIQMARATAAIANGGTVYQPYLVQQIGGRDGETPQFVARPTVVGQAELSPEALAVVREGMCAVTTDTKLGTAWGVFERTPYWACGKTGTAQSGRREPHAWFVAYAPKEDPQIAVAVMAEFSREGSEVAAPIVRRILDVYFNAPEWSYPEWWNTGPYIPLNIPVGETGG